LTCSGKQCVTSRNCSNNLGLREPNRSLAATIAATPERRKDLATATTVAEARRMKTAFGEFAARMLLKRAGVSPAVASRTLADPRDPRQLPDRRCYTLR
jgi:hypothetical protein